MKKLLTATIILIACNAVRAGDSNPAADKKAAARVDTQPATPSVYTPKKKSVFTATAEQHNPFWPIGWVKIESDRPDTTAQTVVPHAMDFSVTTILLNEPPMAVINGKDMAEGEVAALPVQGQNTVVQLMAVQDGRVILRWENQNIVVPIHRDEQLSEAATATTAAATTALR